jgi:probable metal-binding protein
MMKSIHGHEVMQMMLDAGGTFTRESLRLAIVAKFGEDARFHTCSAEGMNAEQLIDFLAARNKFVAEGEGFQTDPSRMCNH